MRLKPHQADHQLFPLGAGRQVQPLFLSPADCSYAGNPWSLGLCQQLVLVPGSCGTSWLAALLSLVPATSAMAHLAPETAAFLHCGSTSSEPCCTCAGSGWFRRLFYQIKHLNSVHAAWLSSQGCSRSFLCRHVSLADFCQMAIHGCGVTERAKQRPAADVPLKTFLYLV